LVVNLVEQRDTAQKDLVRFIADLLECVKKFRNAREAGDPLDGDMKQWMMDLDVQDFPSV